MPSAKQKTAAPPTTAGQAASRYNAAKHGIVAVHQIMFDETAEDLAELAAEYHEQHSPADSGQRFLVDTLINNEWRLRRTRRVEAELWEHATNTFLGENPEGPACSSGDAFARGSSTFERLQRIVNSCERNYHRALKELQRQQVARAHGLRTQEPAAEPAATPPAAPQPEQSTASSANLASFRQNPQTLVPAAPQTAPGPPIAGQSTPASPAETLPVPSDPSAFQPILKQH